LVLCTTFDGVIYCCPCSGDGRVEAVLPPEQGMRGHPLHQNSELPRV
jgi:hypothetical protein